MFRTHFHIILCYAKHTYYCIDIYTWCENKAATDFVAKNVLGVIMFSRFERRYALQ